MILNSSGTKTLKMLTVLGIRAMNCLKFSFLWVTAVGGQDGVSHSGVGVSVCRVSQLRVSVRICLRSHNSDKPGEVHGLFGKFVWFCGGFVVVFLPGLWQSSHASIHSHLLYAGPNMSSFSCGQKGLTSLTSLEKLRTSSLQA